jgi:ribosome biogenesis SPOUT family RNA methylase Rps3
MATSTPKTFTFIVEHLDPELEEWSSLEYASIATESQSAGGQFFLSSVPKSLTLPSRLQNLPGLTIEHRSVEEIYSEGEGKERVCLLDPAAGKELSPEDGDEFDCFLFGGILGLFFVCAGFKSLG